MLNVMVIDGVDELMVDMICIVLLLLFLVLFFDVDLDLLCEMVEVVNGV